jgi:hypothetical protein
MRAWRRRIGRSLFTSDSGNIARASQRGAALSQSNSKSAPPLGDVRIDRLRHTGESFPMEESLKQALADFELFLAGTRAPALIGHSLATVVDQDVRVVAGIVARWAYSDPRAGRDRLAAVIAARNKVFDIFFYRIVRFQRIYDFFPPFERALVRAVPHEDQVRIEQLLRQYPWKEIRPLGSFRDPQEFALEGRKESPVSSEQFNEDLYRNATHQVLAADRRYTFDSQAQQDEIGRYQAQVAEVFDDFVNLIGDAQTRHEIQLANAADRDAVYANRPRFQIETYLNQLADLSVALINDDFFEHGVKVFAILRQLASESRVNLTQLHRFQEKTELFNLQKLGEFGTTKTGAFLMRDLLRTFAKWQPDRVLQVLAASEDRRERKLALVMLEAYGRDIYGMLVDHLAMCQPGTSWFLPRNLAYLLGRIVTDDEELRLRAAELLAAHVYPGNARQLNQQAIQALAFLGNEPSVRTLVTKLAEFGPLFKKDREATDVCQKLVTALVGTESELGLQTAFAFCEQHELLEQYRDVFNRVTFPPKMRGEIVQRIRRELKKLRFSFSILGDSLTTREILGVVGHQGQPDVEELCDEIIRMFPARAELAQAAQRAKAVPAPPPLLASDRLLHRFLVSRDLAQIFCHMHETGASGAVELETRDGIGATVEMQRGEVLASAVPRYFLEGDNAFEWILLAEGRDLQALRYTVDGGSQAKRNVAQPTEVLIREALFQRGEVEQILDGVLSPDARYQRRGAHEYFAKFARVDNPAAHQAVWEALKCPADIRTIQAATKLNRYEICKVLFYLLRQNVISIVDPARGAEQVPTQDDALSAIGLAVRQIEAKPVYFQTYFAAAEACAALRRAIDDEPVRTAARGLRNFFLDAYSSHRVFVDKHVELCTMTLGLMSQYMKTRSDADRRELLDFIAFSFGETVDVAEPAAVPAPQRSLTERIESIEAGNDPFDRADGLFGSDDLDGMMTAFDEVLAKVGGDPEAASAGLTQGEEAMLLDLFGNIATAYVRPLKAFVRELDANHRARRETTADWLDFALPSVTLLAGAATKMGYEKLGSILTRLERTMAEQKQKSGEGDALPKLFCERVLVEHHQLAKLLPSTFSIELSEDELAAKKEGLIVKFILRQVAEVDDRVVNKIVFAGLGSFDRFMEVPSEEIAQVTGISQKLAEAIYMKFYQYRDLYYHHQDRDKQAKLVSLFEISLGILREIHGEVERIAADERARKPVDATRRQGLVADRQRTLWSLFALLCIKGEHDLIERVQMSVFEDRISLLEDYFARIAEASSVAVA